MKLKKMTDQSLSRALLEILKMVYMANIPSRVIIRFPFSYTKPLAERPKMTSVGEKDQS